MMMNKVRDWIEEKGIVRHGDAIVIGLSGGADSVCLLRVLCELRHEYSLTLYAVHINHMIRGIQADSDEEYARQLALSMDVGCRCVSYPVPELALKWRMTEEEAGRRIRYEEFEKERIARGADWIAVAHHQNDQAETILFRMCRGTGIMGMTGIPEKRDRIIRPLLGINKNDIHEYLTGIGQDYREDSTNSCDEYDRNRIRNVIIPELEKINEQAVRHISDMSGQLALIYDWLAGARDSGYMEYVTETWNACEITALRLKELHPALAGEIVRSMISRLSSSLKDVEMRHVNAVLWLADMESGKHINLPYGLIAEKQYDIIRIYKKENGKNGAVPCISGGNDNEEAEVSDGMQLSFDEVYLPDRDAVSSISMECKVIKATGTKLNIPKNNCTKWFDCDKIKNTLSVRRPNSDDYLLIGNNCRKRITRYMIDSKIPRQFRDRLLVVADGSHVLWVVGGRASQGCYVSDETSGIFQIRVN